MEEYKIKYSGKYGSWIESHSSLQNARIRAYALNVAMEVLNNA